MPATTRGEGMTDSPQTGLSTSRNNLALEQPPQPQPTKPPEPHAPLDPPPVNSMRRPASASRTYGRYAVALRAIPDSAAYLDAPTNRRSTAKRKISYHNGGLTGPAPSGMTCPNAARRVVRPRSSVEPGRGPVNNRGHGG